MKYPRFLKYILPVLILAVGFVGMQALVLSKAPPEKKPSLKQGALVKTIDLKAGSHTVKIDATGTVEPALTVHIVPQVGGRVVRLAKGFDEGGFIPKGQLLFEIEDIDYQLAAEKSRAEIARAEYNLASVKSQARVARAEWERVQLEDKSPPNPLVLYEPQLKNAEAALASAKADLEQRLLDMDRTRIYAPFNCRVRSKSVDPGQYVTAGQMVATVVGTDRAEIVVPVPLEELQWLNVPQQVDKTGSVATVTVNAGNTIYTWKGRVDRSLGEVDTQSRMIRLVVQVEDPYGLQQSHSHAFNLAEGLFVDVALEGRTLDQVFLIPASALRYEETIWLMGAENTLDIRPVKVLRREKENVLVRGDMKPGQQMVVTHLAGAAQGMRLRLAKEG